MLRLLVILAISSCLSAQAQQPLTELAIPNFTAVVDGQLDEWKAFESKAFGRDQIFDGAARWQGVKDASGDFLVSWDNNRLYLAGTVRDDQLTTPEVAGQSRFDCLELHLGPVDQAGGGDAAVPTARTERSVLRLFPMQPHRAWAWWSGQRPAVEDPLQPVTQLAGIQVVAVPGPAGGYTFEAAIPFHHFANLRPGTRTLGFDLVLRDYDVVGGGGATMMSWTGTDPFDGPRAGRLRLAEPGLMAPSESSEPLLSGELLVDLPYLLVPLLALLMLVMLLRGWARVRNRLPWLRTVLVVVGVATFLVGLWLPHLMTAWRGDRQREQLGAKLAKVQAALGKLEEGSLASYRGASRDRAVIDLVTGRSIARQSYTSYRSLVDIAPDQFGPSLRSFDDLPVRSYWLPLPGDRPASFQFDPPLKGNWIYLVLARPYVPSFAAPTGAAGGVPRLDLVFDRGGTKEPRSIPLDLPFADATPLGRDFWEASVLKLELPGELRSLSVGCTGDPDLRLVGISLEGAEPGSVVPLSLGEPSRDGVLTDLRGPYPQDAGIELAPGATASVKIPEQEESPERLWLIYRAVYPGLPTANPGARVAEVLLHFADGRQKQTVVLEHQVSMFYELAVHNTRDDPPADSKASIALTWVDESQERHLNLGYPVRDLPTDTSLSAIEFKNLSDYRIRFRSVVFVNDKAVAPQDPPDSPLLREGDDRRLKPEALAELQDLVVSIYRNGQLSESTLGSSERQDRQSLPRSVGAAEATEMVSLLPVGGRRLSLFAPLRGDGWDGAVLAISSTDDRWADAQQVANRLGLLLCLLSTPFLLLLLSELLAVVTNLRFRLMTVMSVASLAPLGVLSLVLVQVLESGHATTLEERVRATVKSATSQLEDQKAGVKASARQWLRDLAMLVDARFAAGEAAPSVDALAEEMQKLLSGQLPPEWRGGFLRLEWQIADGSHDPVVLVAGDERMTQVEAPARLDPGLFMQWGRLMLGVRAEQVVRGDTFTLTAGRPLDGSLLGALAPGTDLLLTDVRGYPIAASEGRESAARLLRQAYDPPIMAGRERMLATGEETRRPVVLYEATSNGDYVVGTEVLRDLQDTPRGLLVVAQTDERATLDLAIGRIPVRAFFLLVAGSLIVLAAFLSFVVSGRISRPIERLEAGAQALSRGAFDTRVPDDEGGQVGRLTRTFNNMAEELQGRLQDLQALNRTMADLAAEHDQGRAIEVLRRFCANHTGADAVVTTMLSPDGEALVPNAAGDEPAQRIELDGWPIVALKGPFCCRAIGSAHAPLPWPWREALPQSRAVLGLPIVFGGQARGFVLLGFDLDEPVGVDLELLTTVVAQAAGACERSQLQRFALVDPVTGLSSPDYFHQRVVDEVSLAQYEQRTLALMAFRLQQQNRGADRMQRFAQLFRERLPTGAVLGRGAASGSFFVAIAGIDRGEAERLRQDLSAEWRALGRREGFETGGDTFASSLALYPEHAPSAEFLFESVTKQLATDPARGAVEAESDASLLRAGVTAVSAAMRPVYSALRRMAPTDLPILIEGETGVGKEVLTDLVHRWSRRGNGPLIKVHCASLSESLLASELFGHERGAFTGADRRKIGRFEQAHGGTLFLDEVGEIPHDVQVALLRALQEGQIDRVGGTEPVKVDVRVVAATNRDMKRMVADGRFREDLYYRLQGMVVMVPPLRERRDELAELVECFRREIVAGGHVPERCLSTDALDVLYRQDWPGNIRQLRTVVFRSMVLAREEIVHGSDVRAALAGGGGTGAVSDPGREVRDGRDVLLPSQPPNTRPVSPPGTPSPSGAVDAEPDPAPLLARSAAAREHAGPVSSSAVASAPAGSRSRAAQAGGSHGAGVVGAGVSAPEAAGPDAADSDAEPRARASQAGSSGAGASGAGVSGVGAPDTGASGDGSSVAGSSSPGTSKSGTSNPGTSSPGTSDSGSSSVRAAGAAPSGAAEVPISSPEPDLPERLASLLAEVRTRGRYTTREHMANSEVSHRTALRDLQTLVGKGLIERVGARRGAWYRPS